MIRNRDRVVQENIQDGNSGIMYSFENIQNDIPGYEY